MPLTYTVDSEADLVRLTGSGTVTDQDVVSCISALRDDPELRPGMDALSDMREIEVAFTSQGIVAIKELLDRAGPEVRVRRIATVTDSLVAYGMGRVTEALLDETTLKYRVFREMDEALVWLGVGD
jgi:hypothetical protein